MDNTFSSSKQSPFLAPFTDGAGGDTASGIKPFAADDIAPASPFLPRARPEIEPDTAARGSRFVPKEAQPGPAFPGEAAPAVRMPDADPPSAPPSPAPPIAVGAPSLPGAGTAAVRKTGTSALPRPEAEPALPQAAPSASGVGEPDAGDMIITTTPVAGGRSVETYLGVVSVEIVIPKDILFRNPAPYGELHRMKAAEDVLQKAKATAFAELAARARALGADAIVGASLQFSQFDALVFLCAATGTAVRWFDRRSDEGPHGT